MSKKRNRRKKYTQEVPTNNPIIVKPRTIHQKKYISSILGNDITFCSGPAGTGKTHIAVGLAIKMLREGTFNRIVVTRPLVSVGKDMGFLPGDLFEKVSPYIQPFFDELNYYLPMSTIQSLLGDGSIDVVPLSMMRGRTFNNAFIILDEAQNATHAELKMLFTRIGTPSKLVVAGDTNQSDLPVRERGALSEAIERLKNIEGINHVELTRTDIVRHKLINQIIDNLW